MSAAHTRLTATLRELRTRTGLSLAALSARTAYSKSSWERYLNGKNLPPRQAVRDLCRVADEPDGRALALWEIAESERSGRAASAAPVSAPASVSAPVSGGPRPAPQEAPPASMSGRPPGHGGRRPVVLSVVLSVVSTLVAVGLAAPALLLLPGSPGKAEDHLPASAPYSLAPQCHGAHCEGLDPMRLICGISPESLATYRTVGGAHVELRHSRKCGAGWARAWGTRVGDRMEVTAGGAAHAVRVRREADTRTYVYTAMAAARPGSTVRVCFRPASAAAERECFEARVGEAAAEAPPASPR
ncbi:helix-turn-helix domain-containing protein [Streptomyces sp. DSM 116494]|uniref:helix-turn-helix domain-containing protein n=1 Tax=Streptomyces TaxID=1883 RepID=UPI0036629278